MCSSAETSQCLLYIPALSARLHDLITWWYVRPRRLIRTHKFITCRNDSYANWDFSDRGLNPLSSQTEANNETDHRVEQH